MSETERFFEISAVLGIDVREIVCRRSESGFKSSTFS